MPPDKRRYLDPSTVKAIANLELRARQVVEGVMTGLHKSPYHGISLEFADHREYVPGDEIKHIDWRVYGRSDRFVIKQYEEETNMRCFILLDTSESMLFKSGKSSKLEYGSLIASAIAYLLLKQRDSVGLVTFDNTITNFLPPRNSPAHFNLMLHALGMVKPGPKTNVDGVFHDLAERIKRRGLVIVVSDLLYDIQKIMLSLSHLKHKRHEVIVFHVLDRNELEFPYDDMVLFKGLENSGEVIAESWAIKKGYLEAMKAHIEGLKNGCRSKGIDYVQVATDEPLGPKLSRYLVARSGGR